MICYEKYKLVKSSLFGFSYKDYPLDRVCGSYLGMLVWKPSLSLWFRYIFLNAALIPKINNSQVLITYSTKRNDYIDLMKAYYPNDSFQYVRLSNRSFDLIFGILKTLTALMKAAYYLGTPRSSFSNYCLRLVVVSISIKIIDELESRGEIKADKYIAFNSSYLIESFLSFYFKKRGVKTYSLQHGMYFKYIKDSTPYDVINYENVCANELLLWGEYTKDQIEHDVPPDVSLSIIGNPLMKVNHTKLKFSDKVYVLLPRDIYWEQSCRLIDLLRKNKDMTLVIRPHPSILDKVTALSELDNSIEVDVYSNSNYLMETYIFKCVISFNSTVAFSAIALGQNFLYYNDKSELDFEPFKTFSNIDEFLVQVESTSKGVCPGYFYKGL